MSRSLRFASSTSAFLFVAFLGLGLLTSWRVAYANPILTDSAACQASCDPTQTCWAQVPDAAGCSTWDCLSSTFPCIDGNLIECQCGVTKNLNGNSICGCLSGSGS